MPHLRDNAPFLCEIVSHIKCCFFMIFNLSFIEWDGMHDDILSCL